jgi:transposase
MGTQRRPMASHRANLAAPRRTDGRGRPWQDTRAVLNGILWALGAGAQWRELPKKYTPYQTCHRRFQKWAREDKLERILHTFAAILIPEKLRLGTFDAYGGRHNMGVGKPNSMSC